MPRLTFLGWHGDFKAARTVKELPRMLFDEGSDETDCTDSLPSTRQERQDRESRARWLEQAILPLEPWLRQTLRCKYPRIEVDDVIQSTYLRLMVAQEVGHIKDARQYLYRTTMSEIMDRVRKTTTMKAPVLDPVDLDTLDIAADEPGPETILDSRRALELVLKALHEMPARHRTVVELRRFEGLTVNETIKRTGRSRRAVELHLTLAMRQLRAALP